MRRWTIRFMLVALLLSGAPTIVQAQQAGDLSRAQERRASLVTRWRAASPEERHEMRAAIRERWESATPRERRRLGRRIKLLERRLPDFSAIERLILLRAAAELPPEERRSLRERIARIDDVEAKERALLISEIEALIAGYTPEIDRLERNKDRWKEMSEAERMEAREQMKRLRSMSVEERRALLEEMETSARRP